MAPKKQKNAQIPYMSRQREGKLPNMSVIAIIVPISALIIEGSMDKEGLVLSVSDSDTHGRIVGEKIILLPRWRRLRYPVIPAGVQDMTESLEVFQSQNDTPVIFIDPPPYK
jgi:hypothetical protein